MMTPNVYFSVDPIQPLYNLKVIALHHSKDLVKTPDFSGIPNLEQLNLEECTKLVHIHPSIGILRKLVYLNLKKCTSLTGRPNNIFGVSSLKVVNMNGCSKLFHSELLNKARHAEYLKKHDTSDIAIQCQPTSSIFKRLKLMLPFPFFNSRRHNDIVGSLMSSLARFYCLQELDLSYCNLLNIPDAMASLHCLEILNLEGNNFVTLPCIMKELPGLLSLKLDHCKQLTSLFEFPLSIVLPILEKLVYGIHPRAGLRIFNCPKLVEIENWSSIAFSWMIQFLKVQKEYSPGIAIVIPGTQIPSWFNNQSVGGSMIVEPWPNVHDDNWIGLAFCAAFVLRSVPHDSGVYEGRSLVMCWYGKKEESRGLPVAEIIERDGVMNELVHLCLLYINRHELMALIRKANIHDIHGFGFRLTVESSGYEDVHLEVKRCGMRVVFKQDLAELNGDE